MRIEINLATHAYEDARRFVRQWAITRWQSLGKLTIPAILLAILYTDREIGASNPQGAPIARAVFEKCPSTSQP